MPILNKYYHAQWTDHKLVFIRQRVGSALSFLNITFLDGQCVDVRPSKKGKSSFTTEDGPKLQLLINQRMFKTKVELFIDREPIPLRRIDFNQLMDLLKARSMKDIDAAVHKYRNSIRRDVFEIDGIFDSYLRFQNETIVKGKIIIALEDVLQVKFIEQKARLYRVKYFAREKNKIKRLWFCLAKPKQSAQVNKYFVDPDRFDISKKRVAWYLTTLAYLPPAALALSMSFLSSNSFILRLLAEIELRGRYGIVMDIVEQTLRIDGPRKWFGLLVACFMLYRLIKGLFWPKLLITANAKENRDAAAIKGTY